MARAENDREDLMREATQLLPRAELRMAGSGESLIFGFRAKGGLSLFFGVEPVYQFNSAGELRRAYLEGSLYKAENGDLVRLDRQRSSGAVSLLRTELDAAAQNAFLTMLDHLLGKLRQQLEGSEFELAAETPVAANSVSRLQSFLRLIESPPVVARRPNAG